MQVILGSITKLFGDQVCLEIELQICYSIMDLLIILGSRLSVPITGYQMKNFLPLSKKIYIDIDEYEIKKEDKNKNKY